MKVLIIGSAGREHVLAWKIKQSPLVKELYCAPGNGGIESVATCVDIQIHETPKLLSFAKEKKIDLVVVGPEAPLVAGITDVFEKAGLMVFGPSAAAAQLEGSKVFAKEFMHKCNIPTAKFQTFDNPEKAKEFLKEVEFPVVVKADGLASGKGVMICKDAKEANKSVNDIMKEKIFKEAGNKIVIEECLAGEEVSILAVCDGENFLIFESAQDHKRIFDDDLGPNTGGMGAYSPSPIIDEERLKTIKARIIEPTIRGMKRLGMPFKGILYAGLMITEEGPMVLEYNVRFGDPEAQAVLPRLENDLVPVMIAACEERLDEAELKWSPKACISVVMSSGGYPGEFKTGYEITGLDAVAGQADTFVFHAGTKKQGDKILTNGGRVLAVTCLAKGIANAIDKVYGVIEKIKFEHCFFRRDIGAKALIHLEDEPKAISHR